MPFFCKYCQCIGHSLQNCKHSNGSHANEAEVFAEKTKGNKEEPRMVNHVPLKPTFQYVPKKDKGKSVVTERNVDHVIIVVVGPSEMHQSKALQGTNVVIIEVEENNDPNRFKGINNIVLSSEEVVESPNPILSVEKNIPTAGNATQKDSLTLSTPPCEISTGKSTYVRSSPVNTHTLGVRAVASSSNNSSTLKMQEVELSSTQSPKTISLIS